MQKIWCVVFLGVLISVTPLAFCAPFLKKGIQEVKGMLYLRPSGEVVLIVNPMAKSQFKLSIINFPMEKITSSDTFPRMSTLRVKTAKDIISPSAQVEFVEVIK
jgi:hypothetical protein